MRLVSVVGLLVSLLASPLAWAAEPAELLVPSRMDQWEFVSPGGVSVDVVVAFDADGIARVAGQPVGYLQTRASHRNYELHVEWRWPGTPGNSGILLHIDSGPIDRGTWPRCLQVQTKHTKAGDILPMAGARFTEPLSTAPDARTPQRDHVGLPSEKPAGEWNVCDVVCRDGTVDVRVNGVSQNHISGCGPSAGRIGLQLEGTPFELRRLTLRALPE